jgi:hypothetical protein
VNGSYIFGRLAVFANIRPAIFDGIDDPAGRNIFGYRNNFDPATETLNDFTTGNCVGSVIAAFGQYSRAQDFNERIQLVR